eukprot:TRINITY_DN22351_c0_g3_i1.p1 TRINITY_DN22351_c0_g3~~TRINITY_DN22351_c0_g3_i1.p1  ORF type:complete len:502 (-),score=55.63 TRINITY_DN22351_c0_g3_i1:266-1771(-)
MYARVTLVWLLAAATSDAASVIRKDTDSSASRGHSWHDVEDSAVPVLVSPRAPRDVARGAVDTVENASHGIRYSNKRNMTAGDQQPVLRYENVSQLIGSIRSLINTSLRDAYSAIVALLSKSEAARSEHIMRGSLAFALLLCAMLPIAIFCTVMTFAMTVTRGQNVKVSFGRWATGSSMSAVVLGVYVALMICNDVIASAAAQSGGGHYPWDPCAIVLSVEMSKFAVSAFLVGVAAKSSTAALSASMWFKSMLCFLPVALLYAGNNCLVLFVLSKVKLDAFVVWRQSAILFNAVFWSLHFGRALRVHQKMAIVALFIGCVLNSIGSDGSFGNGYDWHIALVLASAFCSALASVLNEGVLKREDLQEMGIDRLNLVLYAETSCILIVAVCYRMSAVGSSPVHIFRSFDRSAACIIAAQMTLGLVVSRVLKHTSSVAKTIAGGARELLTMITAPFFVNSRSDWITISSALWIFYAIFMYSVPQHLLLTKPGESSDTKKKIISK